MFILTCTRLYLCLFICTLCISYTCLPVVAFFCAYFLYLCSAFVANKRTHSDVMSGDKLPGGRSIWGKLSWWGNVWWECRDLSAGLQVSVCISDGS